MNKRSLFFCCVCLAGVAIVYTALCTCCSKKTDESSVVSVPVPQDTAPVIERAERSIIVVLNAELGAEMIAEIKRGLDNSFGMINAGTGVIYTDLITYLTYPDDFTREGITRVSDIRRAADDQRARALVIAVPPRYMGNYLSDIRAARPDMALLAALPESEVLPMEAWCDIVLSFALPAASGDESPLEEEENIAAADITRMISLLIKTVEKSPLVQSSSQLINNCKQLAALPSEPFEKPWNLANYKDPDTGLKATNHFVVMQDRQH